jgi:superfamily II DNA or RNA helicase
MELRPYQERALELIEDNFSAGTKRQIMCVPTGGGKTISFVSLAEKYLAEGKPVMILTDRIELMKQAFLTCKGRDIRANLIIAKDKRINKGRRYYRQRAKLHIAMVETLHRRLKKAYNRHVLELDGKIKLLIIDECHKGNFRKIMNDPMFADTYVLGVTATPIAASKKHPLRDFFEEIVIPTTISELIADKYLVPCRTYGAIKDVKGIKKDSTGKYTDISQQEWFDQNVGYKGVVDKYLKHAAGTKALCFCINQAHTKRTYEEFKAAGIPCDYLISDEPQERDEKLKRFREAEGAFVFLNCGILTTGYDNPGIETIILNKKTNSLSLYLQMIGRGSRPCEWMAKEFFRMIDMFSNFVQHYPWELERDWKDIFLNPPQPGKGPTKECPRCGQQVPIMTKVCTTPIELPDGQLIICGQTFEIEIPPKEEKELVEAEFTEIPSELILPDKPFSQMSFEELHAYAKRKKYKASWIWHQVRVRGMEAMKEYQKTDGFKKPYSDGWLYRILDDRRKKLWNDIRAKHNGRAVEIGEECKKLLESKYDGDFFKFELEARRRFL